jgi:cytochrome c oxidase subunit 2
MKWQATLPITFAAAAGCHGNHSALDPAGQHAEAIGSTWWLYFWVCTAIYVVVVAVVFWAALFRRQPAIEPPDLENRSDRGASMIVAGSVVVTVVILFVLLISDYTSGRALASQREMEVTIKLKAHQWWWEVQYDDPDPSQIVTTANEIHIPVGQAVKLRMTSPDVIHSLWIPNLHGKRDIIPGYETVLYLHANREGQFEGQCAEFCGLQHANMRIVLVAEEPKKFHAWLARQRQPAPEPKTEQAQRGKKLFLDTTCIMCHTIQGTDAWATVGPDLTHVASRPLVGNTSPMSGGSLAGWVADPHSIKPGVRMPPHAFEPEDLRALTSYLETLK